MDGLIMVVARAALFGQNNEDFFEGFRPSDEADYQSRILENFQWMERAAAENDPAHKQPIAVAIIVNPTLKQVFVYQRSTQDERYPEKRLQGKWTLCVGGHIKQSDLLGENPIFESLLRELKEEVEIDGSVNPELLGYVNNETDAVGRVHFGILYVVRTTARIVKPKDPEIESGGLRTIEELDDICSSPNFRVEEWARIVLEPLKSYLQSSMWL